MKFLKVDHLQFFPVLARKIFLLVTVHFTRALPTGCFVRFFPSIFHGQRYITWPFRPMIETAKVYLAPNDVNARRRSRTGTFDSRECLGDQVDNPALCVSGLVDDIFTRADPADLPIFVVPSCSFESCHHIEIQVAAVLFSTNTISSFTLVKIISIFSHFYKYI